MESKQSVKLILGSMEFGRPGRGTQHQPACAKMLDDFAKAGFTEVDSAYMYQGGKTENMLGVYRAANPNSKLIYSSKANPKSPGALSAEGVRGQLTESLERLQADSIDLFYLHWPDYNNDLTATLAEVNRLHGQGKFKRFGLSNYAAWQVADICHICRREGFVMPTVYQGMYNGVTRAVEPELFPCLRQFGLAFYAYNPLAGGMLTGRYTREDTKNAPNGRFFGNSWAKAYRDRFWNDSYFDAIEGIQAALTQVYGEGKVGMVEAALRWMMHHSYLDADKGDGLVIGASSVNHFSENIAACHGGPLAPEVVAAFDAGALATKGIWAKYNR